MFLYKAELHEANMRCQLAEKEKEEVKQSLEMSKVRFKAMWIGLESRIIKPGFTCKQRRLGPFWELLCSGTFHDVDGVKDILKP